MNVLRAGIVRDPEWENGSWRYRVETAKMLFVAAFDPEVDAMPGDDDDLGDLELIVVTGWRKR
ncbi:MAG: hypothetical protein U0234_32985 [Sandaracinus sp.]